MSDISGLGPVNPADSSSSPEEGLSVSPFGLEPQLTDYKSAKPSSKTDRAAVREALAEHRPLHQNLTYGPAEIAVMRSQIEGGRNV
jgi:hypothetical protein